MTFIASCQRLSLFDQHIDETDRRSHALLLSVKLFALSHRNWWQLFKLLYFDKGLRPLPRKSDAKKSPDFTKDPLCAFRLPPVLA